MGQKTHHVPDLGLFVESAAGDNKIGNARGLQGVFVKPAQGHRLEKDRYGTVRNAVTLMELADPGAEDIVAELKTMTLGTPLADALMTVEKALAQFDFDEAAKALG